jgi:hypothetical protein
MKKRILKFNLTLIALLMVSFLFAQQKDKKTDAKDKGKIHIETNDGNDYIGELISKDEKSVRIKTATLGEISIPKTSIKNIEILGQEQIKDGEFWFSNPNATRYLFAPSAYNLRKGEGYYQNTWVFLNQVSYGFTDNFTCGIGIVPTFFFGKEAAQTTPVWLTPKFTFGKQETKLNFSVGAIAGFLPFGGADTRGTAGILYGLGTYGNRDNNLSVGLGWGFARGGGVGAIGKRPTLNVSGMYRLSKRGYFVSENWFVSVGEDGFSNNANVSFLSGAYRYAGKNVAIDLGLFTTVPSTGIALLPWLGVTIPFSKKQGK